MAKKKTPKKTSAPSIPEAIHGPTTSKRRTHLAVPTSRETVIPTDTLLGAPRGKSTLDDFLKAGFTREQYEQARGYKGLAGQVEGGFRGDVPSGHPLSQTRVTGDVRGGTIMPPDEGGAMAAPEGVQEEIEALNRKLLQSTSMGKVKLSMLSKPEQFTTRFLSLGKFKNLDKLPGEARAALSEKMAGIRETAVDLLSQAESGEEKRLVIAKMREALAGLAGGLHKATAGDAAKVGSAMESFFAATEGKAAASGAEAAIGAVAGAAKTGLMGKIGKVVHSPILMGALGLGLVAKHYLGGEDQPKPRLRTATELFDQMRMADLEEGAAARRIASSGLNVTQYSKLKKMQSGNGAQAPDPLTATIPASAGY